jgi:hypothetical protein
MAGWGLAMGLVLAWSSMARADLATCRQALSKAHQKYQLAVSKAKRKEILAKMPGGKAVTAEETAAALARAEQKADRLIQAGCQGVDAPSDADPFLCPGLTGGASAFDQCLDEQVTETNERADALENKILPGGPICVENPTCDSKGLPACDPQKECFCHETAEDGVDCINFFSCETAQPCNSSSECPPDHACYVDTCCGASGVCAPALCRAGGSGGSSEGLRSNSPE